MRYALRIFLVVMVIVLSSCDTGMSEEEAIRTAVDFVNEKVRFTALSNETNERVLVNKASNRIMGVDKKDGMWNVVIFVESVVQNKTKSAYFTVVIDSKTGEVKDLLQARAQGDAIPR